MSWSKIPLALRLAAIAALAIAALDLVVHWFPSAAGAPRFWLFRSGVSYAAKGFSIYGALELATLLPHRAALGARLAAAGWAATLVLGFVQVGVAMTGSWRDQIGVTVQWSWWIAMIAVGVGLVLAALRRPILAIAGGVLWLALERPPVFENWLWPRLLNHPTALLAVRLTEMVLVAVVVLGLAAVAVADVPAGFAVRDPQRIRWGHTRIANALWLRVIALSALPLVTLVLMGSHDSGAFKALGYAMVGAGFVNVVSFLGVGAGALDAARANESDLHRAPFYLAAAGALWCAGVTLYQLPELYQMLFGEQTGYLGERNTDVASAFAVVIPFVAAAAIALWTVGAGGFAARRERLDLSDRAPRIGVWFVVLTAAQVAVMQWLLPEARSDGSALLLLVLALVCGLVAIVNAARFAQDVAELANVEQSTIPTATIV